MAIPEGAVQTLLDKDAIRDVLYLYATAIDTWNMDIFDKVFTTDVTAVYNYNEIEGIHDLKRYFLDLRFRGPLRVNALPTRMHFTGNITISLSGSEATTETYLLALNSSDDGRMLVRGNRYFDDFVKSDAGWLIRRRRHVTEWMFDSPVLMDPDRAAKTP